MWHWLPKKLSRKSKFFYQMMLFVAVLHTIICGGAFYFCGGVKKLGDVFVHSQLLRHKLDFIVMPYARHISKRSLNKAIKKKAATQSKSVKKPIKKVVKKPKIVPKVKKAQPVKKVVPEKPKQEVKKNISQREVKPVKKEEVKPKAIAEEKVDDPIYIGKDDMAALLIHDDIATALQQYWSPPAGITPDQVCKILVVLNEVGKIKTLQIVQSSKILAYDMAAQMALSQTEFPKKAWNNEFTLNF
ncbi:hypothetical protein HOM50_02635 [bacterium]|mgnify:CR=1 FL=1|jgi:hypothetical protein|nr:hypothetical protein [bacterium]MBT5015277.1 hypothetical protein [bacterium]